ncbi:hypothetical protein ABW20_dc0107024 [Dactylellina cionopaga]|nr:hypothetical protein ABW20_dc0107024 [Dactylellina cionopaga]
MGQCEKSPQLLAKHDLLALHLEAVANSDTLSDQKESWEKILKLLVDFLEQDEAGEESLDLVGGVGLETLEQLLKFLEKWLTDSQTAIPTPWLPDYKDLVYCSTVEDVQAKVKESLANGSILRVGGAQHSAPQAVFATEKKRAIRVKLEDSLRSIEWLEEDPVAGTAKLRVGAGCNLGIDPSDANSNAGNSLTYTLDAKGYALPILGGMSHQTIGGYMSTSTAGGSINFGCADSILAIELVDGQGEVRVLDKFADPDEFNAAAVSMGLFGVLTHITITVIRKYLVKGQESTVLRPESIVASGTTFLDAVKNNQYVHSVWFAAEFVNSVLQYVANQEVQEPSTPIVPYKHPLKGRTMNYAAAATFLATDWLTFKNAPKLAALIFNFIQRVGSGQSFADHWNIALPNDDQALIDTVIRVQFTEIWIDIEDAEDVLAALTDLFKVDPFAAGNFGVEIYPGKQSPFWMSMSYGRDVIRIDPYWWEYNVIGDLNSYFDKFWKVLLPRFPSARLHWGKHWPNLGTVYGDRVIGPDFVEKSYPMFPQWKELRAKFDPHGVFVTEYWRGTLGL